jgi:choline-sulfatase
MLDIIDGSHLRENTIVVYVSDHGEMGGHHGFWQKQCFYESSVRIPLIIRSPGYPENIRVQQGVSLVDVLPTFLSVAGASPVDDLPGMDLLALASSSDPIDCPIFSEYHTFGTENAGYMIKQGRYKYIYYVGYASQLFNIEQDPDEVHDLANSGEHQVIQDQMHQMLLSIVDPEKVNKQAQQNQAIQGIQRARIG